jgi:hypothetical protein
MPVAPIDDNPLTAAMRQTVESDSRKLTRRRDRDE